MTYLGSFQSAALMISLFPLPLPRLLLGISQAPKATALPVGDSQLCQQDHPKCLASILLAVNLRKLSLSLSSFSPGGEKV